MQSRFSGIDFTLLSMSENNATAPIGIFDSGVGGLMIWSHIHRLLPAESLIYLADKAYCPYGPKSREVITERAFAISRYFISRGCKLIVVACNTATAAAVEALRTHFPLPFVGITPAIKPAALHTKTGVVGILVTKGTIESSLFNENIDHFASGIKVMEQIGEGWVEAVESGETDTASTRALVERQIRPLIEAGADQIVLGCTHYPFLIPLIKEMAGEEVTIVDPAPAIARRVEWVLRQRELLAPAGSLPVCEFYATAREQTLIPILHRMGYIAYDEFVKPLTIN